MNVIFAPADNNQPKKILDAKTWVFVLAQINISGGANIWINHSREEMLAALEANGGSTFGTGSPILGIPLSLSFGNALTGFWWKGEMWAMPDNSFPASLHLQVSGLEVRPSSNNGKGGDSAPEPQFQEE